MKDEALLRYSRQIMLPQMDVTGQQKLVDATVLTLSRGKQDSLVTEVVVQPNLVAPLAVGDQVGTVTVTADGETVFEAPVVALQAVEPSGFFARLWDSILMWFAGLFSTGS